MRNKRTRPYLNLEIFMSSNLNLEIFSRSNLNLEIFSSSNLNLEIFSRSNLNLEIFSSSNLNLEIFSSSNLNLLSTGLIKSTQRNWVLATNSNILIPISLQPGNGININTFKFKLFDLLDFIDWNICISPTFVPARRL